MDFQPGMSSSIDYSKEMDVYAHREYGILEITGIHGEHDLALLKIADTSTSNEPLSTPLDISSEKPGTMEDRDVYVVGHPAWDGRRNDPEDMRRIFSDVYNVKRLQPGKIRSFDSDRKIFEHDCSTLGGNSGSPVIDLETHRVLGLHYSGRYLQGNYSIALWMLKDDEMIKKAGINFV